VRKEHVPAGVAHTRMARRRANQYRTIPGAHLDRRDRQSASTLSATNHTFPELLRRRQSHSFDGEGT